RLLSNFGEDFVSVSLLIECCLQHFRLAVVAKLSRIGAAAPVSCHLVMLHVLRGGDETRVENVGLRFFPDELRSFLEKPLHADALFSLGTHAQFITYLFDSLHVNFGLLQVRRESLLQLVVRCSLEHYWKRLDDLI